MELQNELVANERRMWTGGADAYREIVDEECLVAFTQMAKVASREEVAASVQDGPRWADPEIDVRGLVTPADDVAILTYEARTDKADDQHYRALVSSVYVRRDDGWKLAFHQQTPLA